MVQERHGMLRVWNISLLCATFSLTILGTFLTRSGVIESVHAFASGSVGPMLLGMFAVTVAVSLGLIAWRADRLRSVGRIEHVVSREGAFLANNLVFSALAAVVLLGTTFPLVLEAVNGDRVSVGVPYFSRMTMPLGLALLTLMAIAPVMPWRRATGDVLRERLFWPAVVGVGTMLAAGLLGARGWSALLAFGLGGFAGASALRQLGGSIRRQRWRGVVGRTNGGMVVHLGVVVVAVAFAASASYLRQAELTLAEGERVVVAGHTVEYLGASTTTDDRILSVVARIRVDDGPVYEPRLNRYRSSGMVVGTPSVRVGPTEDVYLALASSPELQTQDGAEVAADEVQVRVIVQPMLSWLWVGGMVMVVGTALALVPARSRQRSGDDPTAGEPTGSEREGSEREAVT
jgi:cytochrome c-type biogenesis protein CcmF